MRGRAPRRTETRSSPTPRGSGRAQYDWTRDEIAALFDLPFTELVFRAAEVHRAHHAANEVQLSTLLSIKTGGCPEDCGYCSQSRQPTPASRPTKLMDVDAVLRRRRRPRTTGSSRFCMGAAWRKPKDRDMPALARWCRRAHGAGNLHDARHADARPGRALAEAGLDYYNHNLDTSPEHYAERHHHPHLRGPARHARQCPRAGINVCCGGIVGMGESRADRVGFLHALATLPAPSRKRADQRARAGQGHGARRHAGRYAAREDRRYRVRPHRRGRPDHHAGEHGPPVRRAREHVARRRRPSASSPAPIRSSPATNCSPPAMPARTRTRRCSRSSG